MEKKVFLDDKTRFLIRNILKGFLYLAILIVIFLLIKSYFSEQERMEWFGDIYDNVPLVMSIFIASEILFGIIPPEVFMLWSLKTGLIGSYFVSIGLLSIISYLAGFTNFTIGTFAKDKSRILNGSNKIIRKYRILFQKYGTHLVIVACVSPLPFSAISLLAGAGGMDKKKYLWYSLLRIVRFFVYAYVLYKIEA
ncbi:YqaA family protein [Aquiflexum lacus]|uniref:YqaA family protein n=1 Tax=Aquiflexum lacus TaxID=2483805 RepID=UPI001895C606|nr:VTT domain-containing protein [Aquiflexum lacus]